MTHRGRCEADFRIGQPNQINNSGQRCAHGLLAGYAHRRLSFDMWQGPNLALGQMFSGISRVKVKLLGCVEHPLAIAFPAPHAWQVFEERGGGGVQDPARSAPPCVSTRSTMPLTSWCLTRARLIKTPEPNSVKRRGCGVI